MAIRVTDYQPNETEAIDTYIDQGSSTTNYGTSAGLILGVGNSLYRRILLRFDWMPKAGKLLFTDDLKIQLYNESSYGAVCPWADLYCLKRDWIESQVTWNIYSTGNNWTNGGGIGTNDTGNITVRLPGLPAPGNWWTFYVPMGVLLQMIKENNYGIIINSPTDSAQNTLTSSSGATAANRPKYTFSYDPYRKIFPISAGLGQVR
jgi:hypothetical protein